ncbi:MAG: UDP-N-acetylglucosamine--N-acetylmuramyl-(pentapeptide) pyrophosphoryl-undecaprenol N-acetylglucosamine transferase [Opitutales bacterium]|nr:UDP-N-acetylglucosamine--N-acetylmuramyl-(pentapeptide) pyrophosphoryl-undecaprenol N-acetylglucosamine transferase [Opitutales bacterium]
MRKTFVIACGGTGGHLSPGIALAERLTDLGYRCVLIVSRKKIDARLLEKYPQLEFRRAPGAGLDFSPMGLLRFFCSQCSAIAFAFAFLLKNRPAAYVSFGGFMTLGMALVCKVLFIPVILHEANRIPGKAVRWISRISTRVYLPPGVRVKGLSPLVFRSAGFPVRREIKPLDKAKCRRMLGFPENGRLVAIFGGSQGAKPLNDWILSAWEQFSAAGISVLCVTGPGKDIKDALIEKTSASGEPVVARFIPFCDTMAEALSAADIVISRAGAGTLAECIACRVPAILVPYPFAADNHQAANAKYYQEKGAGIMVPQSEIDSLTGIVLEIISDKDLLPRFRENIEKLAREYVWDNVVSDLVHYATKDRKILRAEQA